MKFLYNDIVMCGVEINGKFIKLAEFQVRTKSICDKMARIRANALCGDKLEGHKLVLKRKRGK